MKILNLILIILCAVTLTAAQNTQTDEATRLSIEVVKLFKEKKFKEAIPVAQKVVVLRQQKDGANDLKTGEALRNLAFVQIAAGDKDDAAGSFEKAIEIYRAKTDLNKDSQIQLADMLETMAGYKVEDRKIEKAADFYLSASQLREKIYGRDSLEVVPSLWELANIYQYKKDYKNAENLYRRVYEIRTKNLKIDDWGIREARSYYYCMAVRNDNGDEAQKLFKTSEPEKKDVVESSSTTDAAVVQAGIVNGKARYLAKPSYPYEARTARAGGAVNAEVIINEEGKVIFACSISGNKLLYEAVEQAAYQSNFSPVIISGKPVKAMGIVVYNFVP